MTITPLWEKIQAHLAVTNETSLNFTDTFKMISSSNLNLSEKVRMRMRMEIIDIFEEAGHNPKSGDEKLRVKLLFEILMEDPHNCEKLLSNLADVPSPAVSRPPEREDTMSPCMEFRRSLSALASTQRLRRSMASASFGHFSDKDPGSPRSGVLTPEITKRKRLGDFLRENGSIESSSNASGDNDSDGPMPSRMLVRCKRVGMRSPASSQRLLGSPGFKTNVRRLREEGKSGEALQIALLEEQIGRLARKVDSGTDAMKKVKEEKDKLVNRNVSLSCKLEEALGKLEMKEEMNSRLGARSQYLTERNSFSGEQESASTDSLAPSKRSLDDSNLPRAKSHMSDAEELKRQFLEMKKKAHEAEEANRVLSGQLDQATKKMEAVQEEQRLNKQIAQILQMNQEMNVRMERMEMKFATMMEEGFSRKSKGTGRWPNLGVLTDPLILKRKGTTHPDDKIFGIVSRINSYRDEDKLDNKLLYTELNSDSFLRAAKTSSMSNYWINQNPAFKKSESASDPSTLVSVGTSLGASLGANEAQAMTELKSSCKCSVM
eukprot:jgi/Bigna1/143741/aug1.81_g18449